MPFYKRTKILPFACSGYFEKIPKQKGKKLVYENVDLCHMKLVSAEDYDYVKRLNSGLPLQQVNPLIMGKGITSSTLDCVVDAFNEVQKG